MILNNSPVNQATVSNVEGIGEFRIRNSSKAFSILSSGLYANKIRAIIRELSCNALDSHVSAGFPDKPFDVHLPTSLDPHFSIRDYGVGLNHEQVSNIYTTYFESTKTDSNDFVGALGLGSKSPFSYTDNFTVIAIRNGVKGIYTAFINELGIPNIALMMQENTEEPNGIEVKFAISDQSDYYKFRREADEVYLHFPVKPNILNADFQFSSKEYETENIIPGVHCYKNTRRGSVAIMGNIAYPIEIPQADKVLGKLSHLLNCSLEMHFQIGELDFQASREGLSYIPMTVAAIRNKLECLNKEIKNKLKTEVNNISNLWDKAVFLLNKRDHPLWKSAVEEYVDKASLPTYLPPHYYRTASFKITVKDLANKWNIQLIQVYNSYSGVFRSQPDKEWIKSATNVSGAYEEVWEIHVTDDSMFFVNDHGKGAIERVKYNYRTKSIDQKSSWIISPADDTKPADYKGFFAEIFEPPESRRQLISSLEKKPTVKRNTNIGVLYLSKNSLYANHGDFSWNQKGKISDLPEKNGDSVITYYYVPLSGYNMISEYGFKDVKDLAVLLNKNTLFQHIKIYGVRKKDIESVKALPNWVNLETHVKEVLTKKIKDWSPLSRVWSNLTNTSSIWFRSVKEIAQLIDNPNNIYKKFINEFEPVDKQSTDQYNLTALFNKFSIEVPNLETISKSYQNTVEEIHKEYPLLEYISNISVDPRAIADYINAVDFRKGKK